MKNFLGVLLSLTVLHYVQAVFDVASQSNIAVYWGQNSRGATTNDESHQAPLLEYCQKFPRVNIVPIAFLLGPDPSDAIALNLASASTKQTAEDIRKCQTDYGKTILLSLGGASALPGWMFASEEAAEGAAVAIWNAFGPNTSNAVRPFGDAVVDGFDMDFEVQYSFVAEFAAKLRQLMDAATGRKYYLSAAPQCPYPDQNLKSVLQANSTARLDFVMVQFYNNAPCDVRTKANFQFTPWENWAEGYGDAKVLLGLPASDSAGQGYVAGKDLTDRITAAKNSPWFGGVMIWDMSQLAGNAGFWGDVTGALPMSSGAKPVNSTETANGTVASMNTKRNVKSRRPGVRKFLKFV